MAASRLPWFINSNPPATCGRVQVLCVFQKGKESCLSLSNGRLRVEGEACPAAGELLNSVLRVNIREHSIWDVYRKKPVDPIF